MECGHALQPRILIPGAKTLHACLVGPNGKLLHSTPIQMPALAINLHVVLVQDIFIICVHLRLHGAHAICPKNGMRERLQHQRLKAQIKGARCLQLLNCMRSINENSYEFLLSYAECLLSVIFVL